MNSRVIIEWEEPPNTESAEVIRNKILQAAQEATARVCVCEAYTVNPLIRAEHQQIMTLSTPAEPCVGRLPQPKEEECPF